MRSLALVSTSERVIHRVGWLTVSFLYLGGWGVQSGTRVLLWIFLDFSGAKELYTVFSVPVEL